MAGVAIIMDGAGAEGIITVGGIIATEFNESERGRLMLAASFHFWNHQFQVLLPLVPCSRKLMSFRCNRQGSSGVCCYLGQKQKGSGQMSDQSLDARRIAREQASRISAAASVGLNAARPFLDYQAYMLRVWADNVELVARNYEKGIEAFSAAVEQKPEQRAA